MWFILSSQLDVSKAYEHDIRDMQARLRKETKWISLMVEFKFNACWSSKLKIVSDGKTYFACNFWAISSHF